MSEAPKDFQEVTNATEADGLFHEALQTRAAVIIWTQNQKHLIRTRLNPGTPGNDDFSARTPADLNAAVFAREVKAGQIREFYFSVTLGRASVFFKAAYIGADPRGLRFRKPEKIYKVQRRQDLRVPIRENVTVEVKFWEASQPDVLMTHRMFDLSASGLSFLAEETEAEIFRPDTVLHEITWELNQRLIVTDGVVRHANLVQSPSLYKIGVAFKRMKAADTQYIAKYVLEENIRLISRLL